MFEARTTEKTPKTPSLNPTASLETSKVSVRASTPTEIFDLDPVALPMTPRAGDRVAASDNVLIKDISSGKEE